MKWSLFLDWNPRSQKVYSPRVLATIRVSYIVSWSFSPSHDIVSNLNKTNLLCLKSIVPTLSIIRRVWRYQTDNQNRKIEELRRDNAIGKTNLYKTLNRTLIIEQPETGDELMCSGRVGMSWFKSGTCCATMFFDRTCHLFSW